MTPADKDCMTLQDTEIDFAYLDQGKTRVAKSISSRRRGHGRLASEKKMVRRERSTNDPRRSNVRKVANQPQTTCVQRVT
ncbi:hypothetical protein PR001_g4202 [Phytophthora rubi]|uniref:Uncharacterized protein n=1 Tax=Phytophthora rubi TaxID=129364 RepID=A0A6A3NPT3_9STRA|nr:hypothetical protein PR001_g4202 [Phytophthora rubi]